ncbi:DUF6946 family protein [Sinorhizobium fredii]|uniref:DUF6946 family protein n=1 Tax=Rhizobium fredii TaxID=380 RepID=UPI0035175F35
MSAIYVPSRGSSDWQRLLADPEKHWRVGYSAVSLAECWEAARGLPNEIRQLLSSVGSSTELLLALPEHKVPLPGSHRGKSQNDLFALIRVGDQTLAAMVEGKVDESFDKPLGEWLVNASAGKRERLAFICDLLGLPQPLPNTIRYQLLHRTASAIIEAQRFKTDMAAMIVHSFSEKRSWYADFAAFVSLFGVDAEPDRLICVRPERTPSLYLGWATGARLGVGSTESSI